MSQTNYDSGNQGGNFDVVIPSTAYNVYVTAAGGAGGGGGSDSGGPGGGGGSGRYGRFQLPNYQAKTLRCRPGGAGQGGPGCFGRGTGRSGGDISGGGGGSASGCSGSGGGGGGGSGVYQDGLGWIICAGGGGGGGGGSWNRGGGGGGGAGGWGGGGTFGVSGGGDGGGAACGDGAGGGGGGGGAGGAGGGGGGCDFQRGGDGGGGAGSRYASSNGVTILNDGGNGGGGYVRVQFTSVQPEIFSFSANPANQYSTGGTPLYSTTLQWNAVDFNSLVVTSNAGETYNVTNQTSLNITNLAQSNAQGTSPTSRTYTLTACFNSVCVSSGPITVLAKNDNTPSNSWTTQFSNLEPNTQTTLTLGTLAGVDMPTLISTSGSGNFVGNSGSFAGSKYFNNGDIIQLRITTLPFNTDISGLSSTAVFGKTNDKTVTVTTPTGSFDVVAKTRAPKIKEDFDYANNVNKYPYEDIDLITNTPTEYLATGQEDIDDIEIDMEIKVDDPNAQISINGGTWQNVRSI